MDLFYGSVVDDCFDSPKLEDTYISSLVFVYDLTTENDIPTREEWIHLFENINVDLIKKAVTYLVEEYGRDEENAYFELKDYLRTVRPVIKDLKDNPDALFLRIYNGEDFEPENIDDVLLKRAQKHMEEYKDQLPPVL